MGFAGRLLLLTRQLLESLEGTRERPSDEDLSAMRAGLDKRQTALESLRQRFVSLTIQPP
jgi:hypothetical protein